MSDSGDAKAEGQQRDVQVVTVGLGSTYPAELIHPARAATSTRKLFRLVPESELNDPDGELKSDRRRLVILLRERIWTLRLLECEPFCGLTAYQVLDVRRRGSRRQRTKDCPERPLLLAGLAGALIGWESAQASATLLASFRAHQDQELVNLDAVLDPFEAWLRELRRLGMVSEGQTISLRPFLKAKEALRNAIGNLQPVPGAQTSGRVPALEHHDEHPVTIHSVTISTVQTMFRAFRDFGHDTELNARGQTVLKEEFPRDAIYHALEDILDKLGVRNTHGKRFTAAGIQRLLARHRSPPWMCLMGFRDDRILSLDN